MIEFQARPDQRMAERMHSYAALLSEDLARQGMVEGLQILPIVLYTGRARWNVKTSISTLSLRQPGLEPFEAQFRYLLIDRHLIQDQSNIVFLLLELNQVAHSIGLRSTLKELNLWCERQSNQQLVQAVVALVESEFLSEIKCPVQPSPLTLREVIEMMDTLSQCVFEYLKAEIEREERIKGMWEGRKHGRRLAREAGRQAGREEGREEGRLESRVELIRMLLARRHIHLSNEANEQLECAGVPALNNWIEQLVSNEIPSELRL